MTILDIKMTILDFKMAMELSENIFIWTASKSWAIHSSIIHFGSLEVFRFGKSLTVPSNFPPPLFVSSQRISLFSHKESLSFLIRNLQVLALLLILDWDPAYSILIKESEYIYHYFCDICTTGLYSCCMQEVVHLTIHWLVLTLHQVDHRIVVSHL